MTVSLFVDDVDAWFEYMGEADGFELRTEEIGDEIGRVRVFVGYDPEGLLPRVGYVPGCRGQ